MASFSKSDGVPISCPKQQNASITGYVLEVGTSSFIPMDMRINVVITISIDAADYDLSRLDKLFGVMVEVRRL